MPSNGYAYNAKNEILLGKKDTVHQKSSLIDVLSDECAGSIACEQML